MLFSFFWIIVLLKWKVPIYSFDILVFWEICSSLSEYNEKIHVKISNRTSTKSGSCQIDGDICSDRWTCAVTTPFPMRESMHACIFFFVHVKSIYAIINRYRPTSFSYYSAALGNHDFVFDLEVSTCEGSFVINNRSLSFCEYTPRECPTPIEPTANSTGAR